MGGEDNALGDGAGEYAWDVGQSRLDQDRNKIWSLKYINKKKK